MSGAVPGSLEAADQAAQQQSAEQEAGGGAAGCPAPPAHAVEVQVVGEDDRPLPETAVELRKSEQEVVRGRTDTGGVARFDGMEERAYRLGLYELDQDAWEVLGSEPLSAEAAASRGAASWQPPPAAEGAGPLEHVAAPGECIAKISDRYGFFPGTVWEAADNTALRELRGTMYILVAGDRVAIPARRDGSAEVRTGNRYRVRRKGVPETLRVRFLDGDRPRADAPYLFRVKDADGTPVADRKGTTDAEGFVTESLPPSARVAEIVLGQGVGQEVYEVAIGNVDPLDTVRGVQARLRNLGYSCGDEDGEPGPGTAGALRAFQRDRGLPVTGEIDDATRAALGEAFLS